MKYDAVIFDLDGTLTDTLEDLNNAVNYALRQFDLPEKSIIETRINVGHGVSWLIEKLVEGGKQNPHFSEILKLFVSYYSLHCDIKTRPYDGIIPLLDFIKKSGRKTAVVSNKFDRAVKSISKLYFDNYIDLTVGESQNIRKKPAPDALIFAIDNLSCSKERILYVGDSEVDIETAENAGVDMVAVSWGFRTKAELLQAGATKIIDSPEELIKLI